MTLKGRIYAITAVTIAAVIVVGTVLRICLKLFQQWTGMDMASFGVFVFVTLYIAAVVFAICQNLIVEAIAVRLRSGSDANTE